MPKVTITTPIASVELEASESSVDALGKQAIALLGDAIAALPPRTAVGFGSGVMSQRPTYDAHKPINAGGGR